MHLKSNPGDNEAQLIAGVQSALVAYKAGKLCSCGELICVNGSSRAWHMCFTLITSETDSSHDCEIDQACDRVPAR